MEDEIAQQPAVLARLESTSAEHLRAVAGMIRRRGPRVVLLAGHGSSRHACMYARLLITNHVGLPCGVVELDAPAPASGADWSDVLWIAVSQSGASPDLIAATAVASSLGALTLSVTNQPESALGDVSAVSVFIDAGSELAVPATKTYTAQCLALWLLVAEWSGRPSQARRPISEAAAELLAIRPADLPSALASPDNVVFLASGYGVPTAHEAALKVLETCLIPTAAYAATAFMHGPKAMLRRITPVIFISSGSSGHAGLVPVTEALTPVVDDVLISENRDGRAEPRPPSLWAIDVPEDQSPILQVIAFQQLAARMAAARGVDPDRPPGLSKVTLTG